MKVGGYKVNGTAIATGVGYYYGGWAPAAYGAAAGALYDSKHQGGGNDVNAPPRPWTAQDDYGKLDERDWYLNREQGNVAAGGPAWTKDQYKLAQAQYKDEQQRNTRMGEINQWEQSRNPYYASLYNEKVQAAQATNQQSYSDSMKRMQLQHAGRGTLGGSQEQYNQATLGAAKSLRDSQAAQGAQNEVQGLRRGDQQKAQELRMGQNNNPYTDALSKTMANSANIQGGGYAQMADLEKTRMQDEQNYQNNMSQVYGQAISNGAGGAANFVGG